MSVPPDIREAVRQQAQYACEYCGVTETDTGGALTIDHFQPRTHGGAHTLENLLYCCQRCNQYKASYWPGQPQELHLWHPRRETMVQHLLLLADGTLYPITAVGAFTLQRLRLNRPPLVAHRRRRQNSETEYHLLARYRELLATLEHLQQQQVALLAEQQQLLEEQRRFLHLLLQQHG